MAKAVTPGSLFKTNWTECKPPLRERLSELFVWTTAFDDSERRTLVASRNDDDGRIYIVVYNSKELPTQAWVTDHG